MTDVAGKVVDQEVRTGAARPVLILVVASFTAFLGGINMSALNVALPVLGSHFDAGTAATTWILLAYLVTMTGTVLVFGRIADMVGRRKVYLCAMTLFALSSVVAACATDVWVVIAGRALQGTAAGMMFATGGALIASAYSRQRMGAAMGIFFAVNAVAHVLGPVIGGVVTSGLGWEWLFWLNVPVSLLALITGAVVLPRESGVASLKRFDVVGGALSFTVIAAIVTGLSPRSALGWADPLTVGSIAVTVLGIVAFVWWERRVDWPLVDLSKFADRVFRRANLSTLLNCAVRFPLVLLTALMFQTVHDRGPVVAGLVVIPLSVGTMVASMGYGLLERRYTHYALGVAGSVVTTLGVLVLIPAPSNSNFVQLAIVGGGIAGAGAGLLVTANGATVILGCAPSDFGAVNSIRSLLQMLGNTIGTAGAVAVLTIPLAAAQRNAVFGGKAADIGVESFDALRAGFTTALVVLAVLSLISVIASVAARPSVSDQLEVSHQRI